MSTANAPNKSIMDMIFWSIVWIRVVSSKGWIFQLEHLAAFSRLGDSVDFDLNGIWTFKLTNQNTNKNIQQFSVWGLVVVWGWFCIATIHLVKSQSHHTLQLICFSRSYTSTKHCDSESCATSKGSFIEEFAWVNRVHNFNQTTNRTEHKKQTQSTSSSQKQKAKATTTHIQTMAQKQYSIQGAAAVD